MFGPARLTGHPAALRERQLGLVWPTRPPRHGSRPVISLATHQFLAVVDGGPPIQLHHVAAQFLERLGVDPEELLPLNAPPGFLPPVSVGLLQNLPLLLVPPCPLVILPL